jgi:uncharacterized membrane protein
LTARADRVTISAIREMGMKRVLLVGVILTMLAGCGGNPAAVGQNSADSITTTAVGNVVATVPSPTPTPTENAAAAAVPDNGTMSDDSATSNDTATDAAASSDAHQEQR